MTRMHATLITRREFGGPNQSRSSDIVVSPRMIGPALPGHISSRGWAEATLITVRLDATNPTTSRQRTSFI
jgi:hypothetical protein